MQSELIYVEPDAVGQDELTLNPAESHHLTRVLRHGKGDAFFATDGLGHLFNCVIIGTTDKQVMAAITDRQETLTEPQFQLMLAVSIPKKDRFEWIVEKGTEIGVTHFQPLISQRSVVAAKSLKQDRSQKIALSAMKQSGRCCLPNISSPRPFPEFLNSVQADLRLLAHEQEIKTTLGAAINSQNPTPPANGVVCIGPEGGFTDDEVSLAREAGFSVFGMGPRRLRTETAAILAAGLILSTMGELG